MRWRSAGNSASSTARTFFLAFGLITIALSAARAQQSFRTQHGVRWSSASPGAASKATGPESPGARLPRRFLGWREAARQGPDAVKHFRHLLKRSHHRSPILFGARLRGSQSIQGYQARPRAAAVLTGSAGLPGMLLRPSLPAGAVPSAIVTGDFNGDGKLDWIVANAGGHAAAAPPGQIDGAGAVSAAAAREPPGQTPSPRRFSRPFPCRRTAGGRTSCPRRRGSSGRRRGSGSFSRCNLSFRSGS